MSTQALNALATPRKTASGRAANVGLFLLFLVLSMIVTAIGQMSLVPTQWRLAARVGLSLAFLAAAIFLYRSERLRLLGKISTAYLAVALGFLLTFIIGRALPAPNSLTGSPIIALTLSKLFDAAPLVAVMLLLPLLAGDSPGDLYLQPGKLGRSLLLGLLVGATCVVPFVLLDGLEGARAAGGAAVAAALPWIAIFALANSFMEELWWRGLFLRKFQALLGAGGALLLTALGWALMHGMVTYFAGIQLVLFVVWDILLGLAFGWITQRTNTLWGAILAHAIADALLVLGMLSTLTRLG